jgi:hypothetical protein
MAAIITVQAATNATRPATGKAEGPAGMLTDIEFG